MIPKSWTGPTRLATRAPKPIMSVAIAPATGQRSTASVRSIATTLEKPCSRWRRNSTIRWVTVAMPTTVIIAESIVETIVSLRPATASRPRVLHNAKSTTASGTITHRTLRKSTSNTPAASRPAAVPSRLPSRCKSANPSRIITGSPATSPPGSCPTRSRIASIAAAREAASPRTSASPDAVDSSTATIPAVR